MDKLCCWIVSAILSQHSIVHYISARRWLLWEAAWCVLLSILLAVVADVVLYSRKFSNGAHFHIFHMKRRDTKINKNCENFTVWNFNNVKFERGSGDEAMLFYRHFQPLDDLPDPSRRLSAPPSPAAIVRLWEVRCVEVSKVRMTHGSQQGNTASSRSSSR